jgi:hypothetical protein
MHFLYHYVYQDVYIPVWPNIVASVMVGAWVIWRNKTHIERFELRMKRSFALHTSLIGRELEKVHAHVSNLHSTGSDSSGDSSDGAALFAQQEVERHGDHIG